MYRYILEINFDPSNCSNSFQRLYKPVCVNTTLEIPDSVIGRIFLDVMSDHYIVLCLRKKFMSNDAIDIFKTRYLKEMVLEFKVM